MPLCVDLDGTLVRTDLLFESFARLLKEKPLLAALAPLWLLGGRARLKREIASRVSLDAAALPYDERVLAHLREEKARGRRLVLVTASDAAPARAVADHLGLFDEVLASDGRSNLKAAAKAEALVARFGEKGFDYAGNEAADRPVWARARAAVIVSAPPALAAEVRARHAVAAEFPRRGGSRGAALLRLLRPHQWVKNLIVFVPLVTSHQIGQPLVLRDGVLAALAFCLGASAVYALNDLLDLHSDRRHATKRHRPLASGALPLAGGFALAPALFLAAFALAVPLPPAFAGVLALYIAASLAYSWRLKRTPLLDVFVLAGLYTLRLIAGHAATGIVYSDWLLAFSMFIFLSLALVKRFQELQGAETEPGGLIRGRGYRAEDLPLLTPLGAASGYLAVLVLALYVSSEQVRILYRRPTLLLLICPLFLYWISRVWMVAHRGRMTDDPIVFALKDAPSYLVGLLALAVVWLAT